MEDVKYAGLVFSIVILLFGCASPQPRSDFQLQSNVTDTQIQSQEVENDLSQNLNLDTAIFEGANYLASRITVDSKIAVVNIKSPSVVVTNYVLDNLIMHLVNEDTFIVIERSKLDLIEKEQKYQFSGAVSDETVVSIGKQL
jgi:hypothetical protein